MIRVKVNMKFRFIELFQITHRTPKAFPRGEGVKNL